MIKRVLTLSLLLFSFGLIQAQETEETKPIIEKTSVAAFKFRSIGPALTSGRVADLAVNPKDHNEYYVATASGGVWKTTNHGVTYQPVFDDQGSYSIGCVSLDPGNPNVVWVGSGENNNQRSVAYGDGIYKSEDGGKSWTNMGLKNSEHIGMITIHPKNSDIIYVAAYGPLWSSGGDRGIYKTTDGGKNWEKILNVSENTGFNEIHMDPRNPDVLYATAHQRRRHVWTYLSGGPESGIYRSVDGGKNWKELKSGIPGDDKGRIALAIPPSNPDIIYAMIEGHGVYRSADRGASFTFMNKYETSGNYYVELVPHPKDENTVYSMDTYMHISRDGGKSWDRVPEDKKHVDNHCLWINPENPSQMIAGCDGGLYETYDNAANWQFKPNLPITQFYKVTVDNDLPFYNVYGGTQDNFSLGGPSRTINRSGITNADWFVTNTGDGFESAIDPVDPNIIYAQSQYGGLVRYDRKNGESVGIQPSPDYGEAAYRWNWDAPLFISPHDHNRLYFAANKVFRSNDRGNNWEVISPDLSQQIDRHTLPVMGKIWSVDAIAYDRSTSNYGNIVALDESPLQEGLLFAGTDDGLIHVSTDGGSNWTRYGSFPGIPRNTYVNML
ncbi:MAG: WD40/YVTN/BNR-like repeat-containing protein, partial [Owenweeksia sp.]